MNKTEKKSILCPNCRKLISSDEPICPYCGLARPGAWWKSSLARSYSGNPADIVNVIVGINVAFYILSIIINPGHIGLRPNPFTFLSPSDTKSLPARGHWHNPDRDLSPLVDSGIGSFLHGSILHILFNMMALRQLGPFVVFEYGLSRFLSIYILSGVLGFLLSLFAGIQFTIGASASICGLIGAILYDGRSRGGIYGQAIYKQATGWVIGLALFGLLVPGINNWAHGGGIAAGLLMGWLLKYNDFTPESMRDRALGSIMQCFPPSLSWRGRSSRFS